MTQIEATKEAQAIATNENITMVVTFNPYDEDEEGYGYMPKGAERIFKHEEIIETIFPGGN